MKKTKARVLSSAIVAAVVLGTAFPAAVFADTQAPAEQTKTSLNRLFGDDRYKTAAKVATEGWETSKVAVLASGKNENLVDALTAAPFAKSVDAPILLTNGAIIPDATIEALKTLKVEEVYTVSGVIKKEALEKAFKDNKLEIAIKEELGGKDRYVTAKNIASKLKDVEGIMVTTGSSNADALSVASIAAAKNMPILLAAKDGLRAQEEYLDEIKNQIKETYVLGGNQVVSEKIYDGLPGKHEENKKRIFGDDRFETNLKVLKTFADLEYNKVYVGNGNNNHLVDSLVVSVLAAKTNSPIVLAKKELTKQVEDFLLPKLGEKSIVAVGGSTVVTDKALTFNHVRPQDFGIMQFSGVNGYSVGFQIVDGTARDLQGVEVTLYKGNIVLAKNTSLSKLFNSYPTAKELSSPFNINGNFTADGFWNYSKDWNGSILDVPTKAVVKVTYKDGRVYEVVNTKLTGNPADLNKEAMNHVKAEDFGVMRQSGINGYNVGFSLVDKLPVDLESIEVKLVKVETIKDKDGQEVKTEERVLATNKANRLQNPNIFELTGKQLSSPFNVDGAFEGDGYWTYGEFNGTVADVPTKAVITIEYQDGRKFTVQNTVLTGDIKLLAKPAITSGLAKELTVDEMVDFEVATAPNSFVADPAGANTKVRVKITLTKGNKEKMVLQYLENDGTYKDLALNESNSAFYGPQAGFSFVNAASKFKIAFNEAGTYKYTLEVMTVAAEGHESKVLASTTGEVVVTEEATEDNE